MTRTLKVSGNYVPSNNPSNGFTIRPKLTLTGKWLEEAGFLPSSHIEVQIEDGKLTITSLV